MANMSYCRFYNTYQDMLDCYNHLFDDDLSEDEEKARQMLIKLCRDIVYEVGDQEEED